jgi:O-acetylserine/cysteine efflux transporter
MAGTAALPARLRPADLATAMVVIVLWGSNFVAMRVGALEFPPWFLLGLRLGIAALVLMWFVERPKDSRGFADLLAIATTMGVLHFGLAFIAFRAVEASTGAIVTQSAVPFASVLAWFVFGERLGWRRLTGMAIAFAGVVLIAGEPRLGSRAWMIGVLVVSAFCFATANVLIRRLGRVNFMSLNGWIAILGAPQAFALSALFEHGQIDALAAAPWPAFAALGYMALLASVAAHGLWYRLVPRYETNQIMPLTLLVPVAGVIAGAAILGERPTAMIALGGLLTLAGVAVIVLRRPDTVSPAAVGGQGS